MPSTSILIKRSSSTGHTKQGGASAGCEEQLVKADDRDELRRGVPIVELHCLLRLQAGLLVLQLHAARRREEAKLWWARLKACHLSAKADWKYPNIAEAVNGDIPGHHLRQPTERLEGEDLAPGPNALSKRQRVAAKVGSYIHNNVSCLQQGLHFVGLQGVHGSMLLHPVPYVCVVEGQHKGMWTARSFLYVILPVFCANGLVQL